MRILQVRIKNLNSLVGEWRIDLEHPAFASDGIFTITGPTGAGKSTVLDAICLALYGRTPRLSRISKSENEVMSRQTGECFAEVIFETQKGRFLCHWSQHRAHRKSDGELQSPKHEIADAKSGRIIEDKIKTVANEIELATGMDFDRFTRSMLLAQGGFAAFLQASPDERAPILEQITGTEIYSQISVRVHEKRREEQEILNKLEAEISGIEILQPAEKKEIKKTLEESRSSLAALDDLMRDVRKAISWRRDINDIESEINSLEDEFEKLKVELDEFEPDREKLEFAKRAAKLEGQYSALVETRKQQESDQKDYTSAENALPALKTSLETLSDELRMAEHQSQKAKQDLKTNAPVINKVRSLDDRLRDLERNIQTIEFKIQEQKDKIEGHQNDKQEDEAALQNSKHNLEQIENYLENHASDKWLIGGFGSVEQQVDHLSSRQREISAQENKLSEAEDAVQQALKTLDDRKRILSEKTKKYDDALESIEEKKIELEQLLDGSSLSRFRDELKVLQRELTLLRTIASLEEHRARLEDGEACPLCGATEHPYAEGNHPKPDEIDVKINSLDSKIRKAEEMERMIGQFERAASSAQNEFKDAERKTESAIEKVDGAKQSLAQRESELNEACVKLDSGRKALLDDLKPLGIEQVQNLELSTLLEDLRERLKKWQDKVYDKEQLENKIKDLSGSIEQLKLLIETHQESLEEDNRELKAEEEQQNSKRDERQKLFDHKDPDTEEILLNQAVENAEDQDREIRRLHNERQNELSNLKSRLNDLKGRIERREPDLVNKETEFLEGLKDQGLTDESMFIDVRMTPEEVDELTERATELGKAESEINTKISDRKSRLQSLLDERLTENLIDTLEKRLEKLENSQLELQDKIAEHRSKLEQNESNKARVKEKRAIIAAQKSELRKWENLHRLIGSADGKKFRNFVQGLTFETMISFANRQLQNMSDRYILLSDDTQSLSLNVVDSYQAGEIRTTKNLSGGESFIVSLALALGLSRMSSENVRVDSLFLDEGFGTLDEEALDIALDTLGSVQQEGKLIGVISHVPALRERISTQIQVTPQTGGRSQISGPGCSRLHA